MARLVIPAIFPLDANSVLEGLARAVEATHINYGF